MISKYEQGMYRDLTKIADALGKIATALEKTSKTGYEYKPGQGPHPG